MTLLHCLILARCDLSLTPPAEDCEGVPIIRGLEKLPKFNKRGVKINGGWNSRKGLKSL